MVFKSNKEECDENELKNRDATNDAGKKMGMILSVARDDNKPLIILCGGNINKYAPFVDDQDNISGKMKKFFSLCPNPTELLYGSKHYHALYNTFSGRGWLAHCRLISSKLGAVGNGYVLWEIWETRCDCPRLDGILIRPEDNSVFRIPKLENWLISNELSSDVDTLFDEKKYAE